MVSVRIAQRGSLIVNGFMFVLAMVVVIAGIQTMLKEQIRQSTDSNNISLARLQALYLAEMGINEVMFQANLTPDAAFPLVASTTLHFKQQVAMVRNNPSGVADCTLSLTPSGTPGSPLPYQAQATLQTPDGTFTKTIFFDVGHAASPPPGKTTPQWVLTRYVLAP